MPVSVLILTLNEERNIAQCIESLSMSNDIVVLDSGSDDRTCEIARDMGCRVVSRKFDDWATHQNWAVANISFKHPWVYYSDADERMTSDLWKEINDVSCASEALRPVAYYVRYKNYFMGKWIKRCGIYPTWVLRLFRPEYVHWRRGVNPDAEVDGPVGFLSGHFHHFSFSKGLEAWITKHNDYSSREAIETLRSLEEPRPSVYSLFSRNAPERRKALKEASKRLAFRAECRFLYMYLLRGGFLDGKAGFHYCRLLAIYEYFIELKAMERRGVRL